MNKNIGLVLPGVPGYSETFFVSKIQGLAQNGFNVFVLAKKSTNDLSYLKPASSNGCVSIVEPYSVSKYKLIQYIKTICVLLITYIRSKKNVISFIQLERQDHTSSKEIVRLLYINAHILTLKLDWLHFGFATMGINRENVAQAIGAKSAVSFRGYDIGVYPLKHPACYDKLFKKIDKVHSISDSLYHMALSLGLSKEKDYTKITPAIVVEKFTCNRRPIGQKIGILSIGRLVWKKGLIYALEAVAMLDFDFEYTIVGVGEDLERLTFLAHQLGIADKVKFVGKQPHHKITEFMQQADIYLQPSVQEGFCNAVLEAQAAGLICIVSDAEGLPENVEHNLSGFVIPKRNSKAIAHKIKEVVSMNQNELCKMSAYAVERIKRDFDSKDQIKKFITFYQ